MRCLVFSLLCIITLSESVTLSPNRIKRFNAVELAMHKSKIVPDVIRASPKKWINVSYRGGLILLNIGDNLTSFETKDAPVITWDNGKPDLYYTVCMVGPDVPTHENPRDGQWLHWLVGNVRGFYIEAIIKPLAAYVGPGPYLKPGSGVHRSVLLVYQQRDKYFFDESSISKSCMERRSNFSIAKFARKYRMGRPKAAAFFYTQYDEDTPAIHKKLEISS